MKLGEIMRYGSQIRRLILDFFFLHFLNIARWGVFLAWMPDELSPTYNI